MKSAVVFAYHNVGVRSLKSLLALGLEIKLVVTHQDNPNENIWFESVRDVCAEYQIECITPDDPNTPEIEQKITVLAPDFLFSFYYRNMLQAPLLAAPRSGAFNLHGSLLPKYRGRVPINWAIIHGETETGVTLHQMNLKPDNGAIVDQQAVPILPDDTADEVFGKVVVAAEICLMRAIPQLVAGLATLTPQDLSQGAYFGGRKAEDGRIDWSHSVRQIHNLVRAVTRPYPGAFSDTPLGRLILWRTRVLTESGLAPQPCCMQLDEQQRLVIYTADGGLLQVLDGEIGGIKLDVANVARYLNGRIKL
ncbi:formyltransferase [Chitinibacter bivalviorum]|uniref:Formyltransferase n=1 Tax=Chitinibacter bivalviorum TaxID=2739434 RepID=A0A7H9BF94_9NEIS|nr:formyltransferase [Chitinibacter bivalviorum]QLG87289.1 formyltransferase [Chitinibacter bivalviorum]